MKKNEKIFRILIITFFLILFLSILSLNFTLKTYSQDNITSLVNLMKTRYAAINDYQGKIILQVGDNKGTLQEGEMFYKYPGKFKIEINTPEKKVYVCDGKTIYIYYPSLSVVATQNLKKGQVNIQYGQSKETLGYIFDAYTFNFSEGKSLYQFNNFKVYKIKGWAKRVEAGFKSLELYVDETGFIVYQSAVNLEGKSIKYYFTSYKTNQDLSDLLFNFNIPDNVQIIENIFE